MNVRAHWLSFFSALMHFTIAVPELFRIGPRFLPPSWVVVYAWLPDDLWWLYPGLFALTGVIMLGGIRWAWALRLGFQLSSFCYLIWGLVGLEAYHRGIGGNIQGSAANLYIAGAAWVLAHYVSAGVKVDHVNEQVARLGEEVQHVADLNGADAVGV